MENDFFKYFYEETKTFVFSTQQTDVPFSIHGDPHARRIKHLITEIRKMAIKKSFQLAEIFSSDYDREDWIQLSMVTMYRCCENYDRERPFDNYVRFMVSKRLQDQQRSLMRKNPPADRDIMYLYGEMKKIRHNQEAVEQLAEETGRTRAQLEELVNQGVGQRLFTEETDRCFERAVTPESLQPGARTEAKEMQAILFDCVNLLDEKEKALFYRHEIEETSLKILFTESCCPRSFATFKRWYKAEIFEKVQNCVLSRTGAV